MQIDLEEEGASSSIFIQGGGNICAGYRLKSLWTIYARKSLTAFVRRPYTCCPMKKETLDEVEENYENIKGQGIAFLFLVAFILIYFLVCE